MKTLVAIVLIGYVGMLAAHHQNDPYSPVIRLLKEIRKARKHGGGGLIREGEDRVGQEGNFASASAQSPSFGSSQDTRQVVIQFPQATPRPPSSPQDIERINRGVSTILGGVGSGSLEQILRGSFVFTRNDNVRSVANNVISSIFGNGQQPPPQN